MLAVVILVFDNLREKSQVLHVLKVRVAYRLKIAATGRSCESWISSTMFHYGFPFRWSALQNTSQAGFSWLSFQSVGTHGLHGESAPPGSGPPPGGRPGVGLSSLLAWLLATRPILFHLPVSGSTGTVATACRFAPSVLSTWAPPEF